MEPNPGKCPREAAGKRVRVELKNGRRPAESWAADGKFACNWALDGHPYSIAKWEIAG